MLSLSSTPLTVALSFRFVSKENKICPTLVPKLVVTTLEIQTGAEVVFLEVAFNINVKHNEREQMKKESLVHVNINGVFLPPTGTRHAKSCKKIMCSIKLQQHTYNRSFDSMFNISATTPKIAKTTAGAIDEALIIYGILSIVNSYVIIGNVLFGNAMFATILLALKLIIFHLGFSSISVTLIGFFDIIILSSSPVYVQEPYRSLQTCLSNGYFLKSGTQTACCSVDGMQNTKPLLNSSQSADLTTRAGVEWSALLYIDKSGIQISSLITVIDFMLS